MFGGPTIRNFSITQSSFRITEAWNIGTGPVEFDGERCTAPLTYYLYGEGELSRYNEDGLGYYIEVHNYQNLFNLVRKAIEYVEEEIDLICKRITAELEKLPYDDLLKMDSVAYTLPTPNEVSKPRVTYY